MLRIRVNILLVMLLAPSLWACAPRATPAPVVIGASREAGPAPRSAGAGAIVVKPGDTLYAISRYHQTALQALIETNALEAPFIIKPGQVLRLPGQPATPPKAAASGNQIASSALPPPAPRRAPPDRGNKQVISVEAIPPAGSGAKHQTVAAAAVPLDQTPDAGEDQTSGYAMADEEIPLQPRPAPVRNQIAARETIAPSAAAAIPARARKPGEVRFLWPATGPILSEFGPKQNGLHNDGVNIAMPPNGLVLAAGNGVVSYAGNGLRGYGNLLLIRHEGGWVTAYAHNSELLVKKGDAVTRGQVIARAGRSGGVTQDQLHFEIRQGAKAVDPRPLLAGG